MSEGHERGSPSRHLWVSRGRICSLPGVSARSFSSFLFWGSDKGQVGFIIDVAFLSLQISLSSYTVIRFNVKSKPIFLKARCTKVQLKKTKTKTQKPESGSLSSDLDINNTKGRSRLPPSLLRRAPPKPRNGGGAVQGSMCPLQGLAVQCPS